jgi:hypothetical protein
MSEVFVPIHNAQEVDWLAAKKYFGIPYGSDPALNTTSRTVAGALYFNTTDSTVYVYSGTEWIKLGGITSHVFNVADYGIFPGNTKEENNEAFGDLLQTWYTAGGGIIQFNTGTYLFNEGYLIPYGTGALPKQPSLILRGTGCFKEGSGNFTPTGGTVLNIQYVGDSTHPFIDTRGVGSLVIEDLTFFSSVEVGNTPFIKTTNTVLDISRVAFWGFNSGLSANQDAIVLGGTNSEQSFPHDNAINASFQGYGTSITNCYFNKIKRGVWGRKYVNGVNISHNTWWNQCGGDAAIYFDPEFDPDTEANVSNNISFNTIETPSYEYGIYLKDCQKNTLLNNGFFDAAGHTIAGIYLTGNSGNNIVIEGYHPADITGVLDDTDTWQGISNDDSSSFNKLRVRDEMSMNGGTGLKVGVGTSNIHYWHSLAANKATLNLNAADILDFRDFGSNIYALEFLGTDNRIYSSGALRLLAANDTELWLGSPGYQNHYIVNGTMYARGDVAYKMSRNAGINWGDGLSAGSGTDLGIGRNAAGVMEVNNGTPGSLQDIKVRAINPAGGDLGIGTNAPDALFDIRFNSGTEQAFKVDVASGIPAITTYGNLLFQGSSDRSIGGGISSPTNIYLTGEIRPAAIAAPQLKWLTGTGSPEGVVVAAIGSLYTRIDGGAGTTLYVKESGISSTNTGWIAK